MTEHAIATRDEWLEARRDLLAAEKDLTRRGDQVARLRRQLPWVRVDKNYTFVSAKALRASVGSSGMSFSGLLRDLPPR